MNTLDLIFSWFGTATVRGSLLALAVLCIQAALRGRMPARWRYALWLPVVLVLAAPVLPQSRWSVENRIATKVAPPPRDAVAFGPAADAESRKSGVAEIAPASTPSFAWRRALIVAWVAGVLGTIAFAGMAYLQTIRRIRGKEIPADAEVKALLNEAVCMSGLKRAPRLLVSSMVESPAVAGLLRPRILLPAAFPHPFTREEARLVLLHELAHIQRFDLPVNWLLCVLQALHWCNPVLWFAFARMRADREAACDAQVLTTHAGDCRATYGHALLKLESALAVSPMHLGFLGIFEQASGLRTRMRAVAAFHPSHPTWAMAGIAIILALAILGGTRAQDAPASSAGVEAPSTPSPRAPFFIETESGRKRFATAINTKLERKDGRAKEVIAKLQSIVIPRVEFREMTVKGAIEFMEKQAFERDTAETDPAKRGVKFFLKLDRVPPIPGARSAIQPADARITISLTNVPLLEVLKYVTSLANMKFRVAGDGVLIVPLGYGREIETRTWNLIATGYENLPFANDSDAKATLSAAGVSFPEGTSAAVSGNGKRLIVKNSREQLDFIDALLRSLASNNAKSEPENVQPQSHVPEDRLK